MQGRVVHLPDRELFERSRRLTLPLKACGRGPEKLLSLAMKVPRAFRLPRKLDEMLHSSDTDMRCN